MIFLAFWKTFPYGQTAMFLWQSLLTTFTEVLLYVVSDYFTVVRGYLARCIVREMRQKLNDLQEKVISQALNAMQLHQELIQKHIREQSLHDAERHKKVLKQKA